MLTIPSTIETLCKTDGVQKNFRVHFPGGENADLTNADIVSGSVRFTESICSKDVLQFGLAEASRIEFECVNVQNIYGMTIECGIEVDTSSLSAADITAIQGNPGDGTLVLVGDSDIGYGFYRIPYGVFTVTSCPRSAGAMWKRRVEAYEEDRTKLSPFLNTKLSTPNTKASIVQNVACMIAGEINGISNLNVTTTSISFIDNSTNPTSFTWEYNGNSYSFEFDDDITYKRNSNGVLDSKTLLRFTCDIDVTQLNAIYEKASDYGIPKRQMSYLRGMLEPSVLIDAYTGLLTPLTNPEDTGYVYPFYDSGFATTVNYPSAFGSSHLLLKRDGLPIETFTLTPYITNASATLYTLADASDALLNITIKNTSQDNNFYAYIDSFDIRNLMQGYAELQAKYYKSNRGTEYEYVPLSKSLPVSMSTAEYSSLWWDEYDTAPLGSVTLTYFDLDLNQDQTIIYEFGDGLSTYDMTGNYLLKNLAVSVNDLTNQTVEEFVTDLLDTYFIPNITDIAFTPAQLDSLGLPYLEAGDYLEIDDGNGNTVGTYIMSRTISGEQFLEDEIESKGGEIIGNARSA